MNLFHLTQLSELQWRAGTVLEKASVMMRYGVHGVEGNMNALPFDL